MPDGFALESFEFAKILHNAPISRLM